MCPLIHTTCFEDACQWWIKGENRPGGCCIPRLAHYFAGLLKDTSRVADNVKSLIDRVGSLQEDFEHRRH
jgi:hypothetical protein